MLFFKKRRIKSKLGELLMNSGSLWKAGKETGKRSHQSLDDIYGWSDEIPQEPGPNERSGLPLSRNR